MQTLLTVRFLGVGDASQEALGHASIVVECNTENSKNNLLVDCGPGIIQSYVETYNELPSAVFITHCHLDHIADFEVFFIKTWFSGREHFRPKLFVPVSIIPLLHQRVATYPGVLAEGGVNFWDAFQLIPVSDSFEYGSCIFHVFPARHHGANSAFSVCVQDAFFYSGDTRPVPEILEHHVSEKTQIFHDCSVIGNPSHSGIDDIFREYQPATIERMLFYHYHSKKDISAFDKKNMTAVTSGQIFHFSVNPSIS